MTLWDWLAVLLGSAIVAAVLVDVFLAVLHLDIEGLFAQHFHSGVWGVAVFLSRRLPRMRRRLLALAGPVMTAGNFVLWMALFIIGFALIIWPFIEGAYRAEDEIARPLTFVDAVYYSGVTATVLGYGDITPLAAPLKILTFIESGLGFALLTGIVAYLLNVVSGVAERNALAVRIHGETGGTGDGVQLVARYFRPGDLSDLRHRFHTLVDLLAHTHEKMYQFPILDLYYRSQDPVRDPEPMLQALSGAALAGRILVEDERAHALRPAADDLDRSTVGLMVLLARQYFRTDALHQLEDPQPNEDDRRHVEQVRARLEQHLGSRIGWKTEAADPVLRLACRARVFLSEMDRITGWRMDRSTVAAGSLGHIAKA